MYGYIENSLIFLNWKQLEKLKLYYWNSEIWQGR
jgi:hypothetical protein